MFMKGEYSNLKPKGWAISIFVLYLVIIIGPPRLGLFSVMLWVPVWFVFLGSFLKTRRVECLFFALAIVAYNWYSGWGENLYELDVRLLAYLIFAVYIIWKQWVFPGSDLPFRYFRDILELAAKPVTGIEDGYTDRPYPAGKAVYTKEALLGFARFLQKRFIATAYVDANSVKLVFSNGWFQYVPFLKPNWKRATYMTFDFNGNYSVFMGKRHYRGYVAEITFDRLCASLGALITGLLGDYKKGEGDKILNRLRGREIVSQEEMRNRSSNMSDWLMDIRQSWTRRKRVLNEK